jgi:hypothetical protein
MTDKPHTVAWHQYQQALAAKFAKVMADCKREDEREAAANSIHNRGSDRWCEVRAEETGVDDDSDD